ncbi:MAG: hypothetical protein Q9222_000786 [Ikaeria aurantiellina]
MESDSLPPDYLTADDGWKVTLVAVVLIVLQVLAVTARFSARRMQKAPLLADDYWIIPALVFGLALCILAICTVPIASVGRHTAAVVEQHPEKVVFWAKV